MRAKEDWEQITDRGIWAIKAGTLLMWVDKTSEQKVFAKVFGVVYESPERQEIERVYINFGIDCTNPSGCSDSYTLGELRAMGARRLDIDGLVREANILAHQNNKKLRKTKK